MLGAAEGAEGCFELTDLRAVNELAVTENAGNGSVDGSAEPPALRGYVDEGDRFRAHVLIYGALQNLRMGHQHGLTFNVLGIVLAPRMQLRCVAHSLQSSRSLQSILQPTTRRGPLRAEEAGLAGVCKQRVAISRLATPSSPVTAGKPPDRTASRNAINSARNGSSCPTGRCRIE